MKKILNYIRFLRPRQWIKNFAVFASLVFNQGLFDSNAFIHVFYGFLIFCGISSATYIINDIVDIQKDKLHPFKKNRPLANGDISIPEAVILFILLTGGSLFASILLDPGDAFVIPPFFFICVTYLVLQVSYSLLLKHITVLDILAIASGYIIRVYAGEVLFPGSHIPAWLFLTTVSLSLFLAVGKRRSELTLISTQTASQIASIRSTLSHYSERLLDVYASIFATSTFITYALFTFVGTNKTLTTINNDLLLPDYLPQSLQKKWLMITIIPVVYGLMRYLQDIYEKHVGESPERVLLSDKQLLATVIVWVILVIGIIYVLQGG